MKIFKILKNKKILIGGAILVPLILVVVLGLYFKVVNFIISFIFPCNGFCSFQGFFSFWVVILTIVFLGVAIKFAIDN